MKIALISDVHGQLTALKAVFKDIERNGISQIFFLGDIGVLGPQPVECIEMIESKGCTSILGNHDEFMLKPEIVRLYTSSKPIIDAIDWCRDRMTGAELDYISSFKLKLEADLDENNKLLLFHGTPESHTGDLTNFTATDELDKIFEDYNASVIVGGHTHVQMLVNFRGKWFINTGSVGLPFQEYMTGAPPVILPHAEYSIIEVEKGSVSVTLKKVYVDRKEAFNAVNNIDHPLKEMLKRQYM